MLSMKQANNNLPAARKWKAVVMEHQTNSTLQEHCMNATENSQVGCVPIRQSAAGAVTVKTIHGLSRHPILYWAHYSTSTA